jgi:uncharacterized protein DUF6281
MSWVGRRSVAVALTVLAFTAVGCASEGDGVNGESLCASDFVYEARTYV